MPKCFMMPRHGIHSGCGGAAVSRDEAFVLRGRLERRHVAKTMGGKSRERCISASMYRNADRLHDTNTVMAEVVTGCSSAVHSMFHACGGGASIACE
jgi:hypothetical protein